MPSYALRPSAAPVWGNCSGSVAASVGLPNISGEAALRGTAGHWVIECVLHTLKLGVPCAAAEFVGEKAENGVIIDEALAESAQVFVDDVVATAGPRLPQVVVEKCIPMPTISQHNGGTPDAWLWVPETLTLYVWDFKNGFLEVRAKDNLQVVDYSEGIRHYLGISDADAMRVTLDMRIVQPNNYHGSGSGPVDRHVGALSDIRPHVNRLRMKAAEAFSEPKLTTGRHCRYCPARVDCPASRRSVYGLFDVVDAPYDMDTISMEDLTVEYDIVKAGLDQARGRFEAIEETLMHRMRGGEVAPGKALGSKVGREAWQVGPEVVEALAGQFGFSVLKGEVLTPKQSRDRAPEEVREAFAEVSQKLTAKPARGLAIINADDTVAAQVFKRK